MDIKELASEIIGTKTDMIPRDGLHRMLRQRIEASVAGFLMSGKSHAPRLQDMVDAIMHILAKVEGMTLEKFQGDLDRRRIVERNLEIISETSRHLPDALKARHPEVPWKNVAGIGNVIRHDYGDVVPSTLWKLSLEDLPMLEKCAGAS